MKQPGEVALLAFFYVGFWFFARMIMVDRIPVSILTFRAFTSDIIVSGMVFALALVFVNVHRAAAAVLLIFFAGLQLINMELITAMDTTFNFSDSHFLGDREFLENSLTRPLYPGLMAFSLLFSGLITFLLPGITWGIPAGIAVFLAPAGILFLSMFRIGRIVISVLCQFYTPSVLLQRKM